MMHSASNDVHSASARAAIAEAISQGTEAVLQHEQADASGGGGSSTATTETQKSSSKKKSSKKSSSRKKSSSKRASSRGLEPVDTCVVLFKFDATDESELTIKVGQQLAIYMQDDSGWWYAKNADGQEGFVPYNYVKSIKGQ